MSNWKKSMTKSIESNDEACFISILSETKVQTELKTTSQWKKKAAPVHKAATKASNAMLIALLNAGADPNAYVSVRSGDRFTPLHAAVWANRMESVKVLVNKGADVKLRGSLSN